MDELSQPINMVPQGNMETGILHYLRIGCTTMTARMINRDGEKQTEAHVELGGNWNYSGGPNGDFTRGLVLNKDELGEVVKFLEMLLNS